MGRVYNSANLPPDYVLLTQTPKNYDPNNYWIKELQQKVDRDWCRAPNRIDVEYENVWGEQQYIPMEVIAQTVKPDTNNTVISDDWRKLVFRNITSHYPIGSHWRFDDDVGNVPAELERDVWIASNRNSGDMTSSLTCVRCNNTLGSIITDSQGISSYHYEPIIFTRENKTVDLFYSKYGVLPQSEIYGIVQFNKYTDQYYVNQRFVVGYDQVYRITAMNKTQSRTTLNSKNIGTILLYFEVVNVAAEDDFEHRIAFNNKETVQVTDNADDGYSLKIISPEFIPNPLPTNTEINFEVAVYHGDTIVSLPVHTEITLEGTTNISKYVTYNFGDTEAQFCIKKVQFYGGGPLHVKSYVAAQDSPTGEDIILEFDLNMRGL